MTDSTQTIRIEDGLCRPAFFTQYCLHEKATKWLFSALSVGSLRLILPYGSRWLIEGARPGPVAEIRIKRWRALYRMLWRGDLGFADAYIEGDWDTPDLTTLIALLGRNRSELSARIRGSRLMRLLPRLRHAANANTRKKSRRNIEAHYDLGNAFYGLWLDPRMIYSSAIFEGDDTLEAAQVRKITRILELLAPEPSSSILEIGCGWGALARELGRSTQGTVVGVTLSPAQLGHAQQMVVDQPHVDLRLQDYRDVSGTFDRIVSVEMIEAVGEAYLPQYFATIAARLAPQGRAVIQAITIADHIFEDYRRDTDFIQAYIFPGGFLPSKALLMQQAERAGLKLVHRQCFGASYARTLDEWQKRFNAAWPAVERLGFDARFQRTWNYYLSYCSAGFSEGLIDVGLYTFEHANGRNTR